MWHQQYNPTRRAPIPYKEHLGPLVCLTHIMPKHGIFRVLLDEALFSFVEILSGLFAPPRGEYTILVVLLT